MQLLAHIGARLRRRRNDLGLTQARLAKEAGVSPRFLVQLEKGEGNISVARLAEVCTVLGLPLATLFRGLGPGGPDKVALVGLRGAGKSTIGAALAARLGWDFVELDARVSEEAGMRLGELFEIQGEAHYRTLEDRVLQDVLNTSGPMVIATGGSLVTSPGPWRLLRERARTAWLQAPPGDHLERVMAQGDLRPMRGRPNALAELQAILEERAPLYGEADVWVDTQALGIEGAVERLLRWVQGR